MLAVLDLLASACLPELQPRTGTASVDRVLAPPPKKKIKKMPARRMTPANRGYMLRVCTSAQTVRTVGYAQSGGGRGGFPGFPGFPPLAFSVAGDEAVDVAFGGTCRYDRSLTK